MKEPAKRVVRWTGGALLFGAIAIQFVPVGRTNPPIASEIQASAEVMSVLERACYDCHSNETHWPWYSRIAPVSWLVARDVREGRSELNFSAWGELDGRSRAEMMEEVWEEVDEGEMPLWFYTPLHPEARLTADDKAVLRAWAGGGAATEHASMFDDD